MYKLSWQLRIEVGEQLIGWNIVKDPPRNMLGEINDPVYQHLAWLLGYEDAAALMFEFREEDRQKLEQLLGPYGRTIYRIMVLKRTCNV